MTCPEVPQLPAAIAAGPRSGLPKNVAENPEAL